MNRKWRSVIVGSVGLVSLSAVAFAQTAATSSGQTTSSTNTATMATSTMQTNQAQANLQAGQAFLAANKNQPGVVTLPSGLQYKVIESGNGPQPKPQDVVTVDYEGKLINGQVFDSSYKRGQPATFPVNAVIAGWQQALPLMKVGSTWELYIPANLAYGAQGAPGAIGPNETLIFKVHLISIQ